MLCAVFPRSVMVLASVLSKPVCASLPGLCTAWWCLENFVGSFLVCNYTRKMRNSGKTFDDDVDVLGLRRRMRRTARGPDLNLFGDYKNNIAGGALRPWCQAPAKNHSTAASGLVVET